MPGTFGFVIHPTDVSMLHRRWPWSRALPGGLTERLFSLKRPYHLSEMRGVRSPHNWARGVLVGVPLTAPMWHTLPEELVIRRVVQACRIAERQGAKIVGLCGHTALAGDAGREIVRRLSLPVTTGNSYTVAVALEALQAGAHLMGHDLKHAQVAVLGAAGPMGACCVRLLARECAHITLLGRSESKLTDLSARVLQETGTLCKVSNDSRRTLAGADVVMAVSAAIEGDVDPMVLKPGAVLLDVAAPRELDTRVARLRNDVLVLDGGIIAVPGALDLGYNVGLPRGQAWACLGETMLLALEERYESFTVGNDLSVHQVVEIRRLAQKHGFRLSHLRSFHRAVDELSLERIRRNARRNSKRS